MAHPPAENDDPEMNIHSDTTIGDDDDDIAGEEYEVEAILKHQRFGSRVKYFVKWLGYGDDDSTWEFEENLTGCTKLLAIYKSENMARGRPKRKQPAKASTSDEASTSRSVGSKTKRLSAPLFSSCHSPAPPSIQPMSSEKIENDSNSDDDYHDGLPDVIPSVVQPVVQDDNEASANGDDSSSNADADADADADALLPADGQNGFDRGWEPKKVLGVTRFPNGSLYVLVAWEGQIPDLVPNYIANEKIPELMIAYYEQHLQWKQYAGSRKRK